MASSDQVEEIEIGEEHIEMYEECDVANGSEIQPHEGDVYEIVGTDDASGEQVVQMDEGKVSRKRSSRSSSTGPETKPEKDDFDDNELDSDIDESEEKDETMEDPEEEEHNMLSMPQLRYVMNDVGHLKEERRVMVHPLAMDEFSHPAMLSTVGKDTCDEVKIHFVRPKDNPTDWTGIATMFFTSSRAAKESAEQLQTIREDLVINTDDARENPRSITENWAREQKGTKRWTDTLLFVTNVGENVTVDQLKDVFADAEDIVIATSHHRHKDDKDTTKIAYVAYRTSELARSAAAVYTTQSIELDGHVLKIYKYRMPVEGTPRGMLKLHERRVVMKYLEKLTERVESVDEGETPAEWCTKRLKLCKDLLARDNEVRQSHSLATPSLVQMRAMRPLKILRADKRRDLLMTLGVLDRPRRSYSLRDNRGARARRDRSPERRRSGGYRSSSKPQSLLGLPPPSLLAMPQSPVIPISLLMQQGNMALMSGMMNQGMGMMMGSGDGRSSYRGAGGRSSPPGKLLRLDASGNFSNLDGKDRKRDERDRSSGHDRKSSGHDDRSSRSGYSSRDRR